MLAHHYLAALEFARASGQSTETLAGPARAAFAEAGDRAWSLAAPQAAKRFYAAALELWPPAEPGRGALLFRYGRALRVADNTGDVELSEARDLLLADGDRETAAEAEAVRAELSWYLGRTAEALQMVERASGLVEEGGQSLAQTRVLAERARLEMFAGSTREAIEIGRDGLAMAEALGDDEQRAQLLNTIGVARMMTDETDWGAFEDLEQSIALARASHAPDALVRGLANLAAIRLMAGEAGESSELMIEARNVAERFGHGVGVRWVQGQEPGFWYLEGRWDEAFRQADEFIVEVESGSPHYQEAECRLVRGRIRLARGDLDGALEDARKELVVARAAGDPQVLQPGLSFSARVYAATGNTAEADTLASELLEHAPLFGFYADDLAWTMRQLEREEEFLERAFPPVAEGREPTPWRLAACAVLRRPRPRGRSLQADGLRSGRGVRASGRVGGTGSCCSRSQPRARLLSPGRRHGVPGARRSASGQIGLKKNRGGAAAAPE
jgi:tetratricopeptide (TPR) repeat protein